MIQIERRALLGIAGGGLLAWLALRAARARGHAGPLFVSCRATAAGGHAVTGFHADGTVRFDLPLPGRGHAMAFHPQAPHAVVFARRPGRFAVVVDCAEGVALRRIDPAAGRHFYGHGAFSPDGRYLFTTENDFTKGAGVIGIRDAGDGYRQIGEYPSHGVGPHELLLLPGGRLAIANGGILTHPDRGRAKLNLDSMQPSLALLDLADGKLQGEARLAPAQHQLSIRHLAVLGSGALAIAMQYEGGKQDRVPLVAIHDAQGLRTLDAPAEILRRMRHYGGSVAVDSGGELIAVSAPRGNLVTFWDGIAGRYLTATPLPDGCGVAPTGQAGEFLLTSGAGQVMRFRPREEQGQPLAVAEHADAAWDNHLRMTLLA